MTKRPSRDPTATLPAATPFFCHLSCYHLFFSSPPLSAPLSSASRIPPFFIGGSSLRVTLFLFCWLPWLQFSPPFSPSRVSLFAGFWPQFSRRVSPRRACLIAGYSSPSCPHSLPLHVTVFIAIRREKLFFHRGPRVFSRPRLAHGNHRNTWDSPGNPPRPPPP